ncbi:MAG TPA: PAS domain S-box protein, partial [Gammaproteobacteria bacterium]
MSTGQGSRRLAQGASAAALLLLVAAAIGLTWRWSLQREVGLLQVISGQNLDLYVTHLEGELDRYEYLPAILSQRVELLGLLRAPADPARLAEANRLLQATKQVSGVSETYLMDSDGLTLAASNWQEQRTFVGRNFSFRPYFQQAMEGQLGRYFALGTTSQQRGYYFARPIADGGQIRGAIVVKLSIAPIEYEWAGMLGEFVVSDPDGVIFITTRPAWKFNSLAPLPPADLERIRLSRRYSDVAPGPLPIIERELLGDSGASIVRLLEPAEDAFGDPDSPYLSVRYLMQSVEMPAAGWVVHVLADLAPAYQQAARATSLAAAASGMLVLLALFLRQRRATLRQRVRFEQAAKASLEASEARIRAIIDRTRAGLVTLDASGRVQSFNPTAESLFGYRADQVTGRPFTGLLESAAGGGNLDFARAAESGGLAEVAALKANGTRFPLELAVGHLPHDGGARYLATLHDLSLAKQNELELQRARDELEQRVRERTADLQQSNTRLSLEIEQHRATEETLRRTQEELVQAAKLAALGQMSAGITHELSQPLTALRTYADNARKLLAHQRLDEASGNLEQINQLTQRMAQIITQLKAFARKSSGHAVAVSLPAALDGALALLRVDRRPVELLRDLGDQELFVMADMVRLEQVLVNLVGNALQALE